MLKVKPADKVESTQTDARQLADQLEFIQRTLIRTIRSRAGSFRARAEESGITVQQQLLVLELSRHDGLSLKDLSRHMGLSHSTVSGIVDRLERRRLVSREADERDRRITRIYLSEKVKRYVEATKADIYAPVVESILAAPGREKARIVGGLASLCAALEKKGR